MRNIDYIPKHTPLLSVLFFVTVFLISPVSAFSDNFNNYSGTYTTGQTFGSWYVNGGTWGFQSPNPIDNTQYFSSLNYNNNNLGIQVNDSTNYTNYSVDFNTTTAGTWIGFAYFIFEQGNGVNRYIAYENFRGTCSIVSNETGFVTLAIPCLWYRVTLNYSGSNEIITIFDVNGVAANVQNFSANPHIPHDRILLQQGANEGNPQVNFDNVFAGFAPTSITISCLASSWCYLAQNYTNKTLLELDNFYSTDTVEGYYGNVSKKYVSHRTGYKFNENQSVRQGQGYYYYFNATTNVNITIPSTHSIDLVSGWNLIGNLGANRTLSALASSITNVTAKQRYNTTTKNWVDDDLDTVKQGEGFFAYVSVNTTWTG